MKYPKPTAKQDEIAVEEHKLKRLEDERKSLLKREEQVGDDSMERYYSLDAFLELARNASLYWKKANNDKKRKMADILISNVVISGDKVASVTLTPQFEEWAKRKKTDDGRGAGTRTLGLQTPSLALYQLSYTPIAVTLVDDFSFFKHPACQHLHV